MVNLGIFEVLVLAGIFLLVVVVAAIGFLTYRRYTNKSDSPTIRRQKASPSPRAAMRRRRPRRRP